MRNTIWGSQQNDERKDLLVDWVVENGLVVLNDGKEPTSKIGKTRIDLTIHTTKLSNQITNWKVEVDDESFSDHNNIVFEFIPTKKAKPTSRGWKVEREKIIRREN